MAEPDALVDTDTRHEVIRGVAHILVDHYVFPEVAQAMSTHLLTASAAGAYDGTVSAQAFCSQLTADLQEVSRDKHVRVDHSGGTSGGARSARGRKDDSPEAQAERIAEARSDNFGFQKVERLDGNIGYLEMRYFCMVHYPGAGETAIAAMNFLAHSDALIVDLRQNRGGAPSMIALLTSYLFKAEPVHLNSFYKRDGDKTTQSWTLPYVPGLRTPDKPVYVLTSSYTFSAAEEFTYNLKNLKRATIIGETTGGGANPGTFMAVTPEYRVFVPTGRAINPISGTNWEGTGVEPDISLPQAEAFDHAYRLALEAVLEKLGDASSRSAISQAEEARTALSALGSPSPNLSL